MKNDLLIYAVVLNYNGYEDSKKCIISLNQLTYRNIKIVLVDNCSPDGSGEKLHNEFSSIKYILSSENKGYAFGMNLGIKYALQQAADFILLSNNDVEFSPGFIEPSLKVLCENNDAGIVSPKIIYLNDRETIYCAGADFNILFCGVYNPLRGKPASKYGNEKRKVTFAEGSTLLCKKEVFEKVGLISEKYFMYFEDLDFSRKVIEYYSIWYVPESVVFHKGGAGQNWSNYSPLYYYYNTRNRLIFYKQFSTFIRVYAILFTFANCIAKTVVLLKKIYKKIEIDRTKNSINSIWKGFFHGL